MLGFAPCKINLGLDILQKRHDGYHDIDTVMIKVPWCDVVEIVPASGLTDKLTCTGLTVDCPPEKNLVMRAIEAVRRIRPFGPVDVYLHKNVPDGAGLGGGSSDAATAAKLANKLFGLGLEEDALTAMLAGIGSDCPFFVYDGPMQATGTGTVLHRVKLPTLPRYIAIVKPGATRVSTRQAYEKANVGVPEIPLLQRLSLPVLQWQSILENAFEQSVFNYAPEVRRIKCQMMNAGAVYASMSGSGAAVFGLFDHPVSFDDNEFEGCTVFNGRLPSI